MLSTAEAPHLAPQPEARSTVAVMKTRFPRSILRLTTAAVLLAGSSSAPAAASAGFPDSTPSVAARAVALVTIAVRPRSSRSAAPAQRAYLLPVPGPPLVLNAFDAPAQPWLPGHRGVDLAASAGTSVRASAGGRVVFAGPLAGRGVVSVDHGPIRTTYEPVNPAVSRGDLVVAGEVIGTVAEGHPRCAPTTCLHWGARIGDDRYLDPMSLLRGLRVRLLPWNGR